MTVLSHQRVYHRQSMLVGAWTRMLVALLFAFYLVHTQVHLVSELHLDDWPASTHADEIHAASQDHGGPHGDPDHHHTPHSASDHDVQLLSKSGPHCLVTVCLLTTAYVLMEMPEPSPAVPIIERMELPGESPPDPAPPRAPPFV